MVHLVVKKSGNTEAFSYWKLALSVRRSGGSVAAAKHVLKHLRTVFLEKPSKIQTRHLRSQVHGALRLKNSAVARNYYQFKKKR